MRDPNDSFDNIVVELYFKSEETKSSVSRFTRTTSDDTKLKCSFKLANNLLQDAYKKYITVSNNFTKKENFSPIGTHSKGRPKSKLPEESHLLDVNVNLMRQIQ